MEEINALVLHLKGVLVVADSRPIIETATIKTTRDLLEQAIIALNCTQVLLRFFVGESILSRKEPKARLDENDALIEQCVEHLTIPPVV